MNKNDIEHIFQPFFRGKNVMSPRLLTEKASVFIYPAILCVLMAEI